jgi:hypothetical protein
MPAHVGKNAPLTALVGTEKLPDAELQHHPDMGPREIGERAPVVAVNTPCGKPADGTVHRGMRGGEMQCELDGRLIQMPHFKVQRGASREQASQKFHRPLKRRKS